jgi:hypothetical protein
MVDRSISRAALPREPNRPDVRNLLRGYVDVHLEAVLPDKRSQGLRRSQELHARLRSHPVAIGERSPGSIVGSTTGNRGAAVLEPHGSDVMAGGR